VTAAPTPDVAILAIAALSILGVIARPWNIPEALWSVLGAAALVLLSLMSIAEAWTAILKGTDVYLFLVGMMLLAELARREGLFDWLAAAAVRRAAGSAQRLFGLVFAVGTFVTVFLSNDATAVVLTPAVYAATKQARVEPLPYLFICAFVANAASFVLPISNPANLVVYGAHIPSLWSWLREFGVASLLSIGMTYLLLRFTQRAELRREVAGQSALAPLAPGGRLAAAGIVATATVLLAASSLDWPLGLPTFMAGAGTGAVIHGLNRDPPWQLLKGLSWSILPLVAGLFVLVGGIEHTGMLTPLVRELAAASASAPDTTALVVAGAAAVACNALNNLPLALLSGTVAGAAHVSARVTGAILIGVDLGPNLSVTGSLATILWLAALRREGRHISAWQFLALGVLVMPPALIAALVGYTGLAGR
jgi:arsenical pump membrane protein